MGFLLSQSVKNLFLFKDINKDCPNFRATLISRHLIKIDTFPMRELNSQAKKYSKAKFFHFNHLGNGNILHSGESVPLFCFHQGYVQDSFVLQYYLHRYVFKSGNKSDE